jgi:hypothetical protein
MKKENLKTHDKQLVGVCGLFCPACTIFIGTREDPERLEMIAARVQKPTEELQCDGCRSGRRCFYCRERCKMAKCSSERGVDFCGECREYPCEDLKAFQTEMPHRMELCESQERIKEVGYEKWYTEMIEHFSCPKCHTLNSAYDLKCRNCGREPGCDYVRRHKLAIEQYLATQ